jgi:feruloyl esterase
MVHSISILTAAIALLTLRHRPVQAAQYHNEPRQVTEQAPNRCVDTTFDAVIKDFGGSLVVDSPYLATDEKYTPAVLSLGKDDTNVAGICGIRIKVAEDSGVTFDIYLPSAAKWNRRFLTVGNGAFDGGSSRTDMFSRAYHGWAVMSTNTGHEGTGMDWAFNAEAAQIDWAWRAMNQSVPFAKKLVEAYYGEVKVVGNYYSGCSTGGRQGIRQVEVDASTFDGMLIGSPAWNVKGAMPVLSRIGWLGLTYGIDAGRDTQILNKIATKIYEKCNYIGNDNSTEDTVVGDSTACLNFFTTSGINGPAWSGLDCTDGNTNCVTESQRIAFMAMLGEFRRPPLNQSYVGDGFDITAIRDMGAFLGAALTGFDQEFSKKFLGKGVIWDSDENGETLISMADKWDTTVRANADPSILKTWGGKVILYTGTADGFVSSIGTRRAFERAGGNGNENLKYFELPGMPHCFDNGNGGIDPPWYIGGVGLPAKYPWNRWFIPNDTSIALNNPEHDALNALAVWTEGRTKTPPAPAPLQLTSTFFGNWPQLTITKQRPICASPMRQQYINGPANDKSSWRCV